MANLSIIIRKYQGLCALNNGDFLATTRPVAERLLSHPAMRFRRLGDARTWNVWR